MASGIRMRKVERIKPKRKYTKRVRTDAEGGSSASPKSTEAKRAARIVANEKLAKMVKKPKTSEELSPTKQPKASIIPQPLEAKNSPPKVVLAATPAAVPNALPIKPRRGRPPRIRVPVPVPIETHDEPTNGGTDEEIDEEKTICKKSSKKRKETDEEDCSIDVESISPSRSPSPASPGIVQSISSRNSGLIQVPLGPRQSFSWFEVVGITLHLLCEETGRKYFHHKHEICKYMDDNWDVVCLGHERTSTWWKTVLATITTRREFFVSEGRGSGHWKLHDNHADLFKKLWDSHVSGKNAGVILEVSCASAPSKQYQSRRALARSLSPDDDSTTKKRKSTHGNQKKKKLKLTVSEERIESPRANLRRHSYPVANRFGTCHQCDQQRPNVAICTECPLRYCPSCLHDYGETLDKTIKLTNWKCPSCRSICQCERCLEEEEGGIELPSEEHSTKIMASRIGKDGERQYCVRWYDKSVHSFSTSWESKESLIRRSQSLTKIDAQQLQAQMKNILSYDLQCFYRPVSIQPPHKKARSDKLRSADFDIGRMVSPTSLPCRLPSQPVQEVNISTPSWRLVNENDVDVDEGADSDSDSEDEDESDEVFVARHARAAIEMRKQIDRVIETSVSLGSSVLTRSAPSVAITSTSTSSSSSLPSPDFQRASRLRRSK